MKTLVLRAAFAGALSLSLAGCASMNDVLASKNEGTVQTYPVDVNKAWEIAMTVLRWEGAETIEEHRKDGYMLTTMGANLISAGTVIGVWVDPAKKGNTQVTVVTKRKIQTAVVTGLTESTFHKRFAQGVQISRSGRSLPAEAP